MLRLEADIAQVNNLVRHPALLGNHDKLITLCWYLTIR
jgi:hypothetical protein